MALELSRASTCRAQAAIRGPASMVKNQGMEQAMDRPGVEDVVVVSGPGSTTEPVLANAGTIEEPAKVMRIGSMIKQLLEEVRQAPLDEQSRRRLREIYELSVKALADSLSPDLRDELKSLALPFSDDAPPSDAELRIAQAQLVGWLEGLFHGIQATLFAQQMAAQAQIEHMRQGQRGLPSGMAPSGANEGVDPGRSGTYL